MLFGPIRGAVHKREVHRSPRHAHGQNVFSIPHIKSCQHNDVHGWFVCGDKIQHSEIGIHDAGLLAIREDMCHWFQKIEEVVVCTVPHRGKKI